MGSGGDGDRDRLAPLRASPSTSVICSDFDGTLAAIVDDPSAARPWPGAPEVLARLCDEYAVVAVVSGRPVAFLQRALPVSGLHLSGLYGLEAVVDGARWDHPSAGAWREVIDDVAVQSESAGPPGMDVERKGLSLTLHYRNHPSAARRVDAWARHQAARSGLTVRAGRKSVELHPPISVDKGTVVEGLVDGHSGACFFGDDRGDLTAFDALDRLAPRGACGVRVAVSSAEAPAELLARADVVVDGPGQAVALLASLLT